MKPILIDKQILLSEIEHGKNKPTIYDRADLIDWIFECIEKAPPVLTGRVYIVTKKQLNYPHEEIVEFSSEYEMIKCDIIETIIKPNEIPKYRVWGCRINGTSYYTTITNNDIGKTLFTDREEANAVCKKKNKISDIKNNDNC